MQNVNSTADTQAPEEQTFDLWFGKRFPIIDSLTEADEGSYRHGISKREAVDARKGCKESWDAGQAAVLTTLTSLGCEQTDSGWRNRRAEDAEKERAAAYEEREQWRVDFSHEADTTHALRKQLLEAKAGESIQGGFLWSEYQKDTTDLTFSGWIRQWRARAEQAEARIAELEALSKELVTSLKLVGGYLPTAKLRNQPEWMEFIPTVIAEADDVIAKAEDVKNDRDRRQRVTGEWAVSAFGEVEALSVPQRGLRLQEEANEAGQAAGVTRDMAHLCVDRVYDKPAGELYQELGGVGVTTLALAHAAKLSANDCEIAEVRRVLSKPLDHFRRRNQAKNELGLSIAKAEKEQP